MDHPPTLGGMYVTAIVMELRGEIAARGISKKKLAENAGMSYVTLNRYLRGERDIPADVLFRLLMDHLDVDLEKFWKRVEERWVEAIDDSL
jgi:transcriptional regulator with XRE-family HTH domain